MLGRRLVDLGPGAAAADADGVRVTVDGHIRDRAQVDHHAVVHHSEPAAVVPAAAHRDPCFLRTCECDRPGNVVRARAAHDHAGPAIDHAVVHGTGLVVAGVVGADDVGLQPVELAAGALCQGGRGVGIGRHERQYEVRARRWTPAG